MSNFPPIAPEFTETPISRAAHWKDLRGKRVGFLTVVAFAGVRGGNSHWLCRCDCGNNSIVGTPNLRDRQTRSCGCQKRRLLGLAKRTHGDSAEKRGVTVEYGAWCRLRARCLDPKNNRYKSYGGRGIRVCDRWLIGENGRGPYECFLSDMGRRPSIRHSIDRIDVNGNYEPANCRWATVQQQARNRTTNRRLEWKGAVRPLIEICEMEGAGYARTLQRLSDGWTLADAVTLPRGQWRSA